MPEKKISTRFRSGQRRTMASGAPWPAPRTLTGARQAHARRKGAAGEHWPAGASTSHGCAMVSGCQRPRQSVPEASTRPEGASGAARVQSVPEATPERARGCQRPAGALCYGEHRLGRVPDVAEATPEASGCQMVPAVPHGCRTCQRPRQRVPEATPEASGCQRVQDVPEHGQRPRQSVPEGAAGEHWPERAARVPEATPERARGHARGQRVPEHAHGCQSVPEATPEASGCQRVQRC